jgi:hypothetical protein
MEATGTAAGRDPDRDVGETVTATDPPPAEPDEGVP